MRVIRDPRALCERVEKLSNLIQERADHEIIKADGGEVKSLLGRIVVQDAQRMATFLPMVLEACPDYAKERGYAISEPPYDPNTPEEKAKWDTLKEKWDTERAAAGRPSLFSIPNQ